MIQQRFSWIPTKTTSDFENYKFRTSWLQTYYVLDYIKFYTYRAATNYKLEQDKNKYLLELEELTK